MSLIKDTLDKVQEAAQEDGEEDQGSAPNSAATPPPPPSDDPPEPERADSRVPRRAAAPPREATGPGWTARILWSVVVFTVCVLLGAQLVYLAETFFSLSSLLP